MNKVSSVQWNQIWRNFKSIWAFRKVNLEFGKLLRQLWYFYATGQIVIVVNDQRLKNNKVIWSHWFCFLIATYLPQRQLYTWTLQYLIITFQMCLTRKGFIYNDPSWCISAKLITVCFSVAALADEIIGRCQPGSVERNWHKLAENGSPGKCYQSTYIVIVSYTKLTY